MYQHILVAVDGSTTSNLGLLEGVKLACQQHAQLRLIHVVDQTLSVSEGRMWIGNQYELELKATQEAGQKIIDQASRLAREAGLDPQTALPKTVGQAIAEVILEEAGRWPADVIVLGTHGRRGIQHVLLGSVAEGIVRNARVPVLLVRGT